MFPIKYSMYIRIRQAETVLPILKMDLKRAKERVRAQADRAVQ